MAIIVPKVKLNNGVRMPVVSLSFSKVETSRLENEAEKAIKLGFTSFTIDGDLKVLKAIEKCGLEREKLFVVAVWEKPPTSQRCKESKSQSYFDLCLLDVADEEVEELQRSWQAMEDLQKNGFARAIGLRGCELARLKEILKKATLYPSIVQNETNDSELLEFCEENGIGTGFLLGFEAVGKICEMPDVRAIAKAYDKTPLQVFLNHILHANDCFQLEVCEEGILEECLRAFDFRLAPESDQLIRKCVPEKKPFPG